MQEMAEVPHEPEAASLRSALSSVIRLPLMDGISFIFMVIFFYYYYTVLAIPV